MFHNNNKNNKEKTEQVSFKNRYKIFLSPWQIISDSGKLNAIT